MRGAGGWPAMGMTLGFGQAYVCLLPPPVLYRPVRGKPGVRRPACSAMM